MEIIRTILMVGLVLVAAWLCLLLIGFCSQLNQIRLNFVEGSQTPITQNFVFNRVLNLLGLARFDRLTSGILIINALMLWPLSLVFGIPVVKTLREHDRRAREHNPPFAVGNN